MKIIISISMIVVMALVTAMQIIERYNEKKQKQKDNPNNNTFSHN